MSWLRGSPLRTSFSKQRFRDSPPKDADPSACYDSFCKHWQQTYEIVLHTSPPKGIPNQDDVLGVVNHIDQMVTLLHLELHGTGSANQLRQSNAATHSPCLEHLLSENILVKLYEWSLNTGRFNNAVKLEQLKLYELLVTHNGTLLAHEPVARPLLRLLEECENDIMPFEVEKELVILLNQLCVALMQNMALLDLFFHSSINGKSKFIIFILLIPHVHQEGAIGQKARDAMLLCMSLSKKHEDVGVYIADHSNVCLVLATGLSGLYSVLPRKLAIETDDWHRLTPDDVNEMPELTQLMNSLEFCNAVAQVSHPLVQKQLLEFLYQGFLVPVVGPALLQDSLGLTVEQLDAQENWATVEELVAATAYFDLFLRSVTEPGLLRSLVRFLLEDNYDECRILDSLIQRISSRSRLCIVTLALFETLVNLNCEDVMLELCLRALSPCSHVMLSQRRRLRDIDPFGRGAEKFLSMIPNCCNSFLVINPSSNSLPNSAHRSRHSNTSSEALKSLQNPVNYNTWLSESLYGNYHAYLCDARQKVLSCRLACCNWSSQYNGETFKESNTSSATTLIDEATDQTTMKESNIKSMDISKNSTLSSDSDRSSVENVLVNMESLLDASETNTSNESFENSENVATEIKLSPEEQSQLDADIAELLSENVQLSISVEDNLTLDKKSSDSGIDDTNTAMNSLLSIGESSGYESFAFKGSSQTTPDNEYSEERILEKKEIDIVESQKEPNVQIHHIVESTGFMSEESAQTRPNKDSTPNQDIFNGRPNVGIFLDVILRKLECMMSNNLYVNLHLTGLISRLSIYPQPILQSFLLNHSLVFQPSVRSLFQVLASLKHKIDQFLAKHENVDVLVEQARTFLIGREDKLVNARKNVLEAAAQGQPVKRNSLSSEPFSRVLKRCEPKRRSLTTSLTQIFKRSGGGSGPNSLSPMNQSSSISENQLEVINDGSGYRYYTKTSWESPQEITAVQNVVLCAVVLDEWLKELAAIVQEHAVASLSNNTEFKV
ncbi:FHIP family protein AGAP011705-like isoform X2 [Prorops nasuta]|uniref:FHIP family protein AGAP011705-like isoform X2 n=1 Tax=Prorops nasuta TaxID=863751 RepID=UPI0034CDC134